MSDQQYFKCPCKHCRGNIAFHSSSSGALINCPHCGQPTELLPLTATQPQSAPPTPPAPAPAPAPTPPARPAAPLQARPAASPAPQARPAGAPAARPAGAAPAQRPAAATPQARPAAVAGTPAAAAKKPAAAPAPAKKSGGKTPDPYAEMERIAQLVPCPACQGRIEKRAKVCPKCGAALTSPVRSFARFAGISVFVLAFAVPLLWPAGVWPRKEEVFSADTSGLTLSGQVWKKVAGNNLTFVNGIVTNNSSRPFFLVKVEVDLVNNAGAVVGTGSDQVATLDAHKAWTFKVLVVDPEAVSAQPAKLTYQP